MTRGRERGHASALRAVLAIAVRVLRRLIVPALIYWLLIVLLGKALLSTGELSPSNYSAAQLIHARGWPLLWSTSLTAWGLLLLPLLHRELRFGGVDQLRLLPLTELQLRLALLLACCATVIIGIACQSLSFVLAVRAHRVLLTIPYGGAEAVVTDPGVRLVDSLTRVATMRQFLPLNFADTLRGLSQLLLTALAGASALSIVARGAQSWAWILLGLALLAQLWTALVLQGARGALYWQSLTIAVLAPLLLIGLWFGEACLRERRLRHLSAPLLTAEEREI